MKKQDIERLIRGYIRQNIIEQPNCFPDNWIDSLTIGKATAIAYWDHRTDKEIERDKQTGITEIDYKEWVIDEIVSLKKITLYN